MFPARPASLRDNDPPPHKPAVTEEAINIDDGFHADFAMPDDEKPPAKRSPANPAENRVKDSSPQKPSVKEEAINSDDGFDADFEMSDDEKPPPRKSFVKEHAVVEPDTILVDVSADFVVDVPAQQNDSSQNIDDAEPAKPPPMKNAAPPAATAPTNASDDAFGDIQLEFDSDF
jgi:hypothetical protein